MATTEATIDRYFEALQFCIENKLFKNMHQYCLESGIDKRHLYVQRKDRGRGYYESGWLNTLIKVGISAEWLLCGTGNMLKN